MPNLKLSYADHQRHEDQMIILAGMRSIVANMKLLISKRETWGKIEWRRANNTLLSLQDGLIDAGCRLEQIRGVIPQSIQTWIQRRL